MSKAGESFDSTTNSGPPGTDWPPVQPLPLLLQSAMARPSHLLALLAILPLVCGVSLTLPEWEDRPGGRTSAVGERTSVREHHERTPVTEHPERTSRQLTPLGTEERRPVPAWPHPYWDIPGDYCRLAHWQTYSI